MHMEYWCVYFCVLPDFYLFTEEEYKRLSEALADEGTYNAVAFKYCADYYDPSQPTEEEDARKEQGEKQLCSADFKDEANQGTWHTSL